MLRNYKFKNTCVEERGPINTIISRKKIDIRTVSSARLTTCHQLHYFLTMWNWGQVGKKRRRVKYMCILLMAAQQLRVLLYYRMSIPMVGNVQSLLYNEKICVELAFIMLKHIFRHFRLSLERLEQSRHNHSVNTDIVSIVYYCWEDESPAKICHKCTYRLSFPKAR